MYPNQSSPQQWNPNAATPTSQSAPQQGWSPQPPNGQYAPRPPNQIPPISQALPQQGPAMQTLQPQHPEQYRALPPPQHMYGPPYQQGPPMAYAPQQPAPRQRTAIACRYCRRRKIRCSGFDQSEDGRCTNCQRFSQECIFTPVSAQTQAFVPAHTVWRGQNPPQGAQLYGAYGQPLPQHGGRDPYPPQQPGQYPPPPQGYQQPPMYGQPPQVQTPQAGQKRSSDEPHTPTLPPPHPGAQADMSQQPYGYPQPPAGASPASSTASFFHYPVPAYYYDPYQYARASPQSAYSYEPSQASSSPNTFAQHGSPVPLSIPYSSYKGQTSSPVSVSVSADAQRQGVKINELVGPAAQQQAAMLKQQEERTSTDTTDHAGDPSVPPNSTKRNGVDIGVQTEESLMHKEPAS